MPQVVDSDREAVRPVAVAVTNRQVAAGAGYLVGARSEQLVHPALRTATECDPQRRPVRAASPAIAGAARAVPGRPWSAAHSAKVVREHVHR